MAAEHFPARTLQRLIGLLRMLHVTWQKNVVAAGMASRCEVQLAYAIGVAEPVSVSVDTFGTGRIEEGKIINLIRDNFELKPAGLISFLKLMRPIYRKTSAYGHFGREVPEFTWEVTDKADDLRKQAGL